MIRLQGITFKYDKVIFSNISLDIDQSKITFIIGSNGSGKSTLANIISGLLFPQVGKVYLDDLEVSKKINSKIVRKKVGIIFQNPSNQILFSKVSDDIKFTLENMKIPKEKIPSIIQESLKEVGMLDFIDANPYNLSGGQKQRIAIASQLALKPDYLIFDEATSMLDSHGKKEIYHLIQNLKGKMGIIFITNHMDELLYADDVIIIDRQKVYKYTLSDILKENSILTNHKLDVPFLFKIANALNIEKPDDLNENTILEGIGRI